MQTFLQILTHQIIPSLQALFSYVQDYFVVNHCDGSIHQLWQYDGDKIANSFDHQALDIAEPWNPFEDITNGCKNC